MPYFHMLFALSCCNFIKFCFCLPHPAIRASLACLTLLYLHFPTTATAVLPCFWPTCFGFGGEECREYLAFYQFIVITNPSTAACTRTVLFGKEWLRI